MNKEKKTYALRVGIFMGSIIILSILYVGFCDLKFGKCIGGNSILGARTLFHIALSLLCVVPALFFISNSILKRWLVVSLGWFTVMILWIMILPEYSGHFIEILATKEQASVFMSITFVIISLIMFIWLTIKEKKNK